MHKMPPPGLHIALGIVNDGLKRLDVLNSKTAAHFLVLLSLARAKQWGGHVNGRECARIMEKLHVLKEVVEWRDGTDSMEEIASRDTDAAASERR